MDLRLVNEVNKIEALPAFDCFVSIIVLQHNLPPVIAFLLRTMLGKLSAGGLAYFQVSTFRKARTSGRPISQRRPSRQQMEMHVLPQAVVWNIAYERTVTSLTCGR